MTAPPFMPLYIGDWVADTLDFSTLEDGAYFRLVRHAWRHDATIPDDDRQLALITGMRFNDWQRHKHKLLGKFVATGSKFVHRRVRRELAKALKKRNTALHNLAHVGRHIIKKENTTTTSRAERDRAAEKKNGNGAASTDQQAELPLPRVKHKQLIPVSDELKYLVARPARGARKGGGA